MPVSWDGGSVRTTRAFVYALFDEYTEARVTQAQVLALFSEFTSAKITRAVILALYDELPNTRVTQIYPLYIHGDYPVDVTATPVDVITSYSIHYTKLYDASWPR